MRRRTRAAVAATAGLLLIGGAGTLSYWTDEKTVDGVELVTGQVKLGDVECENGWLLDGSPLGVRPLVPTDVVTSSCTFTLDIVGENAVAELAVTQPTISGDNRFADQLVASAEYLLAGEPLPTPATVDAEDAPGPVTAELSVSFEDLEPGVQNLSNMAGLQAALDSIKVTLVQQTPLSTTP